VFFPGLFPLEFRAHDGAVGTYFEAAAVIVTLVNLGDFFSARDGSDRPGHPKIAATRAQSAWRLGDDVVRNRFRSKVSRWVTGCG